jgi:hypothetical protein
MIRDSRDGLFSRIARKEESTLVGDMDHVCALHVLLGGSAFRGNLRGGAAHLAMAFLPFGHAFGGTYLHSGDLALRAVRGPIREFGGDHVRAGHGMVEGGVDHAGLHALRDAGMESYIAGATGEQLFAVRAV